MGSVSLRLGGNLTIDTMVRPLFIFSYRNLKYFLSAKTR